MNCCTWNECGKQTANLQCTGCRLAYYCSKEHQKADWKSHKHLCRSSVTPSNESKASVINESNSNSISENSNAVEKRECRCMFCGETLLLASEEEAIAHMTECCHLQEQLASKDQFTIPSALKEKVNINI